MSPFKAEYAISSYIGLGVPIWGPQWWQGINDLVLGKTKEFFTERYPGAHSWQLFVVFEKIKGW